MDGGQVRRLQATRSWKPPSARPSGDEALAKWEIKLEPHGEVKEDEADVLINAAGCFK